MQSSFIYNIGHLLVLLSLSCVYSPSLTSAFSHDRRISKIKEENNDQNKLVFSISCKSLFSHSPFFVARKTKVSQRVLRTILPIEFRPLPHLIFTIELTTYTEYIIIKVAITRTRARALPFNYSYDRGRCVQVYGVSVHMYVYLFTKQKEACMNVCTCMYCIRARACICVTYAGAGVGLGWDFRG